MTRGEAIKKICDASFIGNDGLDYVETRVAIDTIQELSTSEIPNKCDVIPGRCKDCKYFEYDKFMMIGGLPLIAMHEYCGRWGDGVKSSENGFCFLFERKDGTVQRG